MDKKKCIIDKYTTTYGFNLYVIVNPDKTVIDKQFCWADDNTSIINDEYSSYVAYEISGAVNKASNKQCIIIIVNKIEEDKADCINTISHESFHATMDIMNSCHVKYGDDSCEAFAYLQGYITECVYRTIEKV